MESKAARTFAPPLSVGAFATSTSPRPQKQFNIYGKHIQLTRKIISGLFQSMLKFLGHQLNLQAATRRRHEKSVIVGSRKWRRKLVQKPEMKICTSYSSIIVEHPVCSAISPPVGATAVGTNKTTAASSSSSSIMSVSPSVPPLNWTNMARRRGDLTTSTNLGATMSRETISGVATHLIASSSSSSVSSAIGHEDAVENYHAPVRRHQDILRHLLAASADRTPYEEKHDTSIFDFLEDDTLSSEPSHARPRMDSGWEPTKPPSLASSDGARSNVSSLTAELIKHMSIAAVRATASTRRRGNGRMKTPKRRGRAR